MVALRIRHCRLHLVRHGGWSWGPQPRRLLDQATQRLPAWLMQELAAQLADHPDDVTIARLQLRIPLRLAELSELAAASAEVPARAAPAALIQRARTILAHALDHLPGQPSVQPSAPAPALMVAMPVDDAVPAPVLAVLAAWQRTGDLAQRFGTADGATLAAWIRALLDDIAQQAASGALREPVISAVLPLVAQVAHLLDDAAVDTGRLIRCVDDLVMTLGAPPATASNVAGRSAALAASAAPPAIAMRAQRAGGEAAAKLTPTPGQRPRARPMRQPLRAPVAVDSVLPFIVMGILARRHYFDGLRAALASAALLDQSHCFGAAMAYKLAPPPRGGWDRSAATRRVAAVMCGHEEPPDNASMARFLRGLSGTCAPLDAALLAAMRARRKSPGILVDGAQSGRWAVLDIASAQPLLWGADSNAVLRLADLLPGRLWWLAPAATASPLAQGLTQGRLRAVALGASPPAAGWRAAGEGIWTNEPLLCRHGARLQCVLDEARAVLALTEAECLTRRPLLLPASGPVGPAEASIMLAVCSALGELAHTLWHGREATQPLLALQRFADFGGTVSIEEERVLVRPVLGRRFMDVSGHGMLRDIGGIPWWPGRRVEFAGP
jgi:hypothetical protein